MLVIGSSLQTPPASKCVGISTLPGGSFVMINLQKTPLDQFAKLRIRAKIEDVFELLMKELKITIPTFKETRWMEIKVEDQPPTKNEEERKDEKVLIVAGLDDDGSPLDIFERIRIGSK